MINIVSTHDLTLPHEKFVCNKRCVDNVEFAPGALRHSGCHISGPRAALYIPHEEGFLYQRSVYTIQVKFIYKNRCADESSVFIQVDS